MTKSSRIFCLQTRPLPTSDGDSRPGLSDGMDTGPIIVQRVVPIQDDDTPESLHARIQQEEHLAYPQALSYLAAGRLRIDGRRVIIASA